MLYICRFHWFLLMFLVCYKDIQCCESGLKWKLYLPDGLLLLIIGCKLMGKQPKLFNIMGQNLLFKIVMKLLQHAM